jgi:hypothetical protein
MTHRPDRLCALADSLPGSIRWRFSDYEQILTKQLKLLASPVDLAWSPRSGAQIIALAARRARTDTGSSS